MTLHHFETELEFILFQEQNIDLFYTVKLSFVVLKIVYLYNMIDALSDLILFARFKKREKRLWESDTLVIH